MNYKIKQKMLTQMNNQVERKNSSKGDGLLESLKAKRTEFRKQANNVNDERYKFEDSEEKRNISKDQGGDREISRRLNTNQTYNTNREDGNVGVAADGMVLNTYTSMEGFSKKEVSIDAANLYDASVKPRKGDMTPKSNFSKNEEIIIEKQEKNEKEEKEKEENNVEEIKNNEISQEKETIPAQIEQVEIKQEDQVNKVEESPAVIQNAKNSFPTVLETQTNEERIKQTIIENELKNINRSSKSISSNEGNDISIASHSDDLVKKLQERLVLKGKDMVVNSSQNQKTSNNVTSNNKKPIKEEENFKSNVGEESNNINLKLNLAEHYLTDETPHHENELPQSIGKQFKTSSNFNNNNNKTDYSKFNLQNVGYELIKQYTKTKISKNENFLQRMNFDVFKRQTKDERINNLIERNKLKLNEVDRVNAFNRLIEDANRRLEAVERLDSLKNHITTEHKMKKSMTTKDWSKVYNERFINFKKEKEEILEKRIIEKEKQLKEEEDKIIEEMNARTKKAPKRVVEKVINRMYEEAEKRKVVNEQRQKEIELIMEKQKREMVLSTKRIKKEIDFKVQSDLSKPTSAYLGKLNKKKPTNKSYATFSPSHNTKKNIKKEKETILNDKYLTLSDPEDENIQRNIPIPTDSGIYKPEKQMNLFNELKSPTSNQTKNRYASNHDTKRIKYVPDILAKNLVDNILNKKIN